MQESEKRQRKLLSSMTNEQVIESHIISQLVSGDWAVEIGRAQCDCDRTIIEANRNYSKLKIVESLIGDKGLDLTRSALTDITPVISWLESEKKTALDDADYERASILRTMSVLLEGSLRRMAAVENKLNTKEVRDGDE